MKTILSAIAAAAVIAPSAAFADIIRDPGFTVPEIDPGFSQREPVRRGIHPLARILLFPIVAFAELQAELSPDKASCWNDQAGEVAGCRVVDAYDEAAANRPTPY